MVFCVEVFNFLTSPPSGRCLHLSVPEACVRLENRPGSAGFVLTAAFYFPQIKNLRLSAEVVVSFTLNDHCFLVRRSYWYSRSTLPSLLIRHVSITAAVSILPFASVLSVAHTNTQFSFLSAPLLVLTNKNYMITQTDFLFIYLLYDQHLFRRSNLTIYH